MEADSGRPEEQQQQPARPELELERFTHNFTLLDNAVTSPLVEEHSLEVYVSWLRWVEQGNGTETHTALCFDTFLPRTIKLLLTSRNDFTNNNNSNNNNKTARMVNAFLRTLLHFAVMRINSLSAASSELPPALADCVLLMCNPCAPFYLVHMDVRAEEEGEDERNEEQPAHLTARETEELKLGDRVRLANANSDVVVEEGEIVDSSPTDTEVCILILSATSAAAAAAASRRVWVSKDPKSFWRLDHHGGSSATAGCAPPAEDKPEYALFRRVLAPGVLFDCLHEGKWYQAVVVDEQQQQEEEGLAPPLLRIHVLGFPHELLLLPRSSLLLAPLNTHSRGQRGSQSVVCPSLVEDDDIEACVLFTDFATTGATTPLLPRKSKPSSSLFLANLNEVYGDLVQAIFHCAAAGNLRVASMCVGHLLPYLSETACRKLADEFPTHMLHCTRQLSKQQVRSVLTKQVISRALNVCHRLVRKMDPNMVGVNDLLRLEFVRKLVESEMIMKRVDGLQMLTDIIAASAGAAGAATGGAVVVYEESTGKYTRVHHHAPCCSSSRAELAAWCQQTGVLQSFFLPASRAHAELVRRSAPLVLLLNESAPSSPLFTLADFDMIWRAGCGGEEDADLAAASVDILGQCCHSFSPEVKRAFSERLVGVASSQLKLTGLLKNLITASADLADVALEVLWGEATTSIAGGGQQQQQEACAALVDALQHKHPIAAATWAAELRARVVARCCCLSQDGGGEELLLCNGNVLRVMRAALESLPSKDHRARVIAQQQQHGQASVVDRLIGTFALGEEGEVPFRLDFLSYVLRARGGGCKTDDDDEDEDGGGGARIELHELDALWTNFERRQNGTLIDAFFNWLQKLCRLSYSRKQAVRAVAIAVSADTMRAVFDRIARGAFTSGMAFRVFQASLVGVNLAVGRMQFVAGGAGAGTAEKGAEQIQVLPPITDDDASSESYVGERRVWAAALGQHADEDGPSVAESAAHYISHLRLRTKTSTPWRLLRQHVERVLGMMTTTTQQNAAHACALLTYLLTDAESEFAALVRANSESIALWRNVRPHSALGAFPPSSWVTVSNNIKGTVGFAKKFRIHVRANDPVGKLRARIADSTAGTCSRAEDIRLFAGGAEMLLKSDAKPFYSLAPLTPHMVACRRIPLAGQDTVDTALTTAAEEEEDVSPEQLQQWLDPVADFLLDVLPQWQGREEVGKAVKLLALLPTSHRVEQSLMGDDDKSFALLSSASFEPHRVTYQLQILQHELHSSSASAQSAMVARFFPALQALVLHALHDRHGQDDAAWILLSLSLVRDVLRACVAEEQSVVDDTDKMAGSALSSSWPVSLLQPLVGEHRSAVLAAVDAPGLQRAALTLRQQHHSGALAKVCLELWLLLIELDSNQGGLFDAALSTGLVCSLLASINNDNDDGVNAAVLAVTRFLSREQVSSLLDVCLAQLPSTNSALVDLVEQLMQQPSTTAILHTLLRKLDDLCTNDDGASEAFPRGQVSAYNATPDTALLGLLRLITATVSSGTQVDDVSEFNAVALCVLDMPNLRRRRCVLPSSRRTAYECLLAICRAFSNADEWFARMLESAFASQCFFGGIPPPPPPPPQDLDMRSPLGFVGIVNCGATCYMNSLFQQLWAAPQVRNAVLALTLLLPADDNDEDVRLVQEMQRSFQDLSYSTRRTCSLAEFVSRFKEEDGGYLSFVKQQDAQEIFEKVCDRLDDCLARHDQTRLFRDALGVKIASEFVCLEEDGRRKEDQGSWEWCLKVQLPPGSSSHSLPALLDKLAQGEVLQQFTWEEEGGGGKPKRTRKRQVIKSLAHTLAIHLGRFHMNWDTQVCEKTNDRVDFPLELDMAPYCCSSSSSSSLSLMYKLVGVLVHDGGRLNSGHYYSFCQSRHSSSSNNTLGKWYCFNDSVVSEFDVERELEEAAFGGMASSTTTTPRTHSAYMLFYERVTVDDDAAAAAITLPPPPRAVLEANHDHLLASRLLDPALHHFILARCTGAARLFPTNKDDDDDDASLASVTTTASDALLRLCASRFLTGDALAARACASYFFVPVADRVSKWLNTTANSSEFLLSLRPSDLHYLLVGMNDYRVGIAFAGLCCVAIGEADDSVAAQTMRNVLLDAELVHYVVSSRLAHEINNNCYWYLLSLVSSTNLDVARAAFAGGLLPIVFNAVLESASPTYQVEFAGRGGFVPRRSGSGEEEDNHTPAATTPVSWEHAISACISCTTLMLAAKSTSSNGNNDEDDDGYTALSWACANSMEAWCRLVPYLEAGSHAMDVLVLLFSSMLDDSHDDDATALALALAKSASVCPVSLIARYYDVVASLPPQVTKTFFLGSSSSDEEGGAHSSSPGLFRLLATSRANRVTFACIALFVERVEQFPALLASPQAIAQWFPSVDGFLRSDAVARVAAAAEDEEHGHERLVRCMQMLAAMNGGGGGGDIRMLAREEKEDDNDERSSPSSSLEGLSNSDVDASMMLTDDEEEEEVEEDTL